MMGRKNPFIEEKEDEGYTINGVNLLQNQVCKEGTKGLSLN